MNFRETYFSLKPLILNLEITLLINVSDFFSEKVTLTLAKNDPNFQNGFYKILNILVKSCESGEVYDSKLEVCVACERGKYSFSPDDAKCHDCPDQAFACYQDNVDLKPGFWRSSQTQNIYECDPFSESCLYLKEQKLFI